MIGPELVAIEVDGESINVLRGRSLFGALTAAGVRALRLHPVSGELRGGYCGMGVCFECEVEVDGRPRVRSCLVEVDGPLSVRTGLASKMQP